MKSQLLLILSHGAVALAAIAATFAASSVPAVPTWAIVAGSGLTVALFAGLVIGGKIAKGTEIIHVMLTNHQAATSTCGIGDLDKLASKLTEIAKHYDEVEAKQRRHSREIKAVLSRLSRRETVDEPDMTLLKNTLSSIGRSLAELMDQVEKDVLQLGNCTQQISTNGNGQSEIVGRTEAAMSDLSQSIQDANTRAAKINDTISATESAIAETIQSLSDANVGVSRIRSCSDTSAKKLRALCDPTRQITNLVAAIGDVAARTEMLALNASIESIRAGEHGRSFAVVADEIRKLAEQTGASANEIGLLAESLESQTNDSIAVLEKERLEVDSEAELIASIEQSLQSLTDLTRQGVDSVTTLVGQNKDQQEVVQNVLGNIESLGGTTQSKRGSADQASWSVQSLAKVAIDIDSTIHRLKGCGDPNAPAENTTSPQLAAIANQSSLTNAAQTPVEVHVQ